MVAAMEDNAADSEADRKNSDDVGGRNRPSKKYHTFSNRPNRQRVTFGEKQPQPFNNLFLCS